MITEESYSDDDEIYSDALEDPIKNNQYYNLENYKSVKNSEIFENKNTIAFSLYNQPDSDKMKIENKPRFKNTGSTELNLIKFELQENGYIAKLENDSQIITITGKNAYIITPDFMDSDIERKEDRRKNVNNGILGYYSTNPKINSELKLNIIITVDIGVDINKIFTIEYYKTWFNPLNIIIKSANYLLGLVKEFGHSSGYRISSDERNYIQFILDTKTLTILANKKKAIDYYKDKKYHPDWINTIIKNTPKLESIVEYIYDTTATIFRDFCKAKVDEEKNLELTLTPKNIFMSGEIVNQTIEKIEEKAAKVAPKADEEDNKKYIRNNVSHNKPSEREDFSSQNETLDNSRVIDINVTEVKNTNIQINDINSEEESSSLPETAISTDKTLNSSTKDSDLQNESLTEKEIRKKYLSEKFRYTGERFGKIARHSNHQYVPKEEQLSIDLCNKPKFSVVEKILYWIENNFKYFFPAYNLFPEVGTKDRKIPGTDYKVKYFTEEEQTQHTKEIIGDKLYGRDKNGELEKQAYDTSNFISKGEKGCVAYVVTLDGKLITHEHVNFCKSEYLYRHSTLIGGEPVICAGLMKVENGKITHIDNNSGHYKTKSAHLYKAIKILKPTLAQNAKISCSGSLLHFMKNICIKGFYVFSKISTTKEPVEKFLNKMEKAGKNGLTKTEKYFQAVKDCDERYERGLFYTSYKSPTSEPANKPTIHQKHKLKFSSYINSYLKFLKDISEDPKVKKITIEHSIRKIIGAEPLHKIGHMPKIEFAEQGDVTHISFYYEKDYKKFCKLLDWKKYKHEFTISAKEQTFEKSEKYKCKDKPTEVKQYTVCMDINQFNKFTKNVLKIELTSALSNIQCKNQEQSFNTGIT